MLISLPKETIVDITKYLELEDIIELGNVNKKLNHYVYTQPAIWSKHVLFPIKDSSITDKFIKKTIPKITRFYGILEIQMIDLPLTWLGYFLVFDQFAHSLTSISIQSNQFLTLLHHLSRFATHLAKLQEENKIPCTFREYASEIESEETMSTMKPLPKILTQIKLDDPPFERLNHISITSQTLQDDIISQLQKVFLFLSGFNTRSKRTRDISSANVKRQNTNHTP